MSAQYDDIAEQYRRTTESPLRRFVEAYTLLRLIGDVRGKSVLDLGCGEGFFARRFMELGATRVVGVDISPAMIELAQAEERENPQGIDYICADVRNLTDVGDFDIVAAAYLLHYSKTEGEMQQMCASIARHLSAGGRFVTLNENPDQAAAAYAGYEQYGFNKTVVCPRREGSEITYWMVSGRELFKFHAWYFNRDTYERVLRGAGFSELNWHPLALDPAGVEARGEEYWQEYLANPPVVGLDCRN
jgi:ubiquinone/menaquinone biosynthesis C-methylase UbiE